MKWTESKRDQVRDAAARTTEPTPGEMPAWVRNKPACRWAWAHHDIWRRNMEHRELSGDSRAFMVDWARSLFAAEMRRRDAADRAEEAP